MPRLTDPAIRMRLIGVIIFILAEMYSWHDRPRLLASCLASELAPEDILLASTTASVRPLSDRTDSAFQAMLDRLARSRSEPSPMSVGFDNPCDLNRDGNCDDLDFMLVRSALGKSYTDAGYLPKADFDADGVVTEADEGQIIRFAEIFAAPFKMDLDVKKAKVILKEEPRNLTGIEIRGRIAPDTSGDGMDAVGEKTIIRFNGFREEIRPGQFVVVGNKLRYSGATPGIEVIELGPEGQFKIQAHLADPSPIDLPGFLWLVIQIGNDRGESWISIDQDGKMMKSSGYDVDDDKKENVEVKDD